MGGDPLRAAGGLIVREGRILLVHRAKYDDWAPPKGKLDPDETWEEAALREVEEETGLACVLGAYVGTTRYDVPDGPKEVRWYRMTADGEARPQNEIDEIRWVSLDEAPAVLSYDYDRELLVELGSREGEPSS